MIFQFSLAWVRNFRWGGLQAKYRPQEGLFADIRK